MKSSIPTTVINENSVGEQQDTNYLKEIESTLAQSLSYNYNTTTGTVRHYKKQIERLIEVVNEWDVDSLDIVEAKSSEKYEDLERKLNEVKAELAECDFADLKLLKKEIQKVMEAKGNTKDRCLRQIRLTKLNRNLSVLKYA